MEIEPVTFQHKFEALPLNYGSSYDEQGHPIGYDTRTVSHNQ